MSARGWGGGAEKPPRTPPGAEHKHLAWHLPDDFNSLPPEEQQQIVDWVRRAIISGAIDYRLFLRAAVKQRYAIRFRNLAYGTERSATLASYPDQNGTEDLADPDLHSGVIDAPPRLADETAALLRFKTATLTAIGLQRNGVWCDETAFLKLDHFGLMFGALAADPNGEIKGCGVPVRDLTFGLFIFPGVWDWYMQWREHRRGFYTA
jgi:hypothetical protein